MGLERGKTILKKMVMSEAPSIPVSYTHLDVYKRQPFEMLVKRAGLRCMMTSFNKLNGVFAGGSKELCTRILRQEWGFDGLVVTDWGDMDIVVDGADAVAAGNDVVMPGGPPVIVQIVKGYEEGRVTVSYTHLDVYKRQV